MQSLVFLSQIFLIRSQEASFSFYDLFQTVQLNFSYGTEIVLCIVSIVLCGIFYIYSQKRRLSCGLPKPIENKKSSKLHNQ